MYIVVRCWYPPDKANEVGRLYKDMAKPKFPPIDPDEKAIKTVVLAAVTSTKDSFEAFSVFQVENGGVGKVLERTIRHMALYREIEGFRYEIKPYTGDGIGIKGDGIGIFDLP